MRKALLPKYPELEEMRLVDFKVRILTPQRATAAVTRVMIESTDETVDDQAEVAAVATESEEV